MTHADVLPTLLDLLGIERSAVGRYGDHMPGRSLLRPLLGDPMSLLSNCADFYACRHPSFAALSGSLKLIAPAFPPGEVLDASKKPILPVTRQCFDVDRDPKEIAPLPVEACDLLRVPLTELIARTRLPAR